MRTLVDIEASEPEALNALSKSEGISRAESIRRAIKSHLELIATITCSLSSVVKSPDFTPVS